MGKTDARVAMRWRSAVVIAVAALMLLSGGKYLAGAGHHQAHDPQHPLAASLAAGFVVTGDHDHIFDSCESANAANLSVPAAVMRGGLLTLVALGVIAVAAVAFAEFFRPGVRGPPRGTAVSFRGRDVLTRLCIARR